MILNAGLLIDFGNSRTRVIVICGKQAYRFDMSNQFVQLPRGYAVPPKYKNDKTIIFQYGGNYFANGQIVEREFVSSKMRPSALQPKTQQVVTDLTINLALIRALNILGIANNMPVSALDVTFRVSVLLPPIEHEVREQDMIDKIKAYSSVSLFLPVKAEYNFKISDEINVYGEAIAAFFGAIYMEQGVMEIGHNTGKSVEDGDVIVKDNSTNVTLEEVPENSEFLSGYTLVMDIGAGTTDLALFLDGELVENSKETFNIGGNTVESVAQKELKKKFGYVPTSMDLVIGSAILEEGDFRHDVSDIVTYAKNDYSRQMNTYLRNYLESLGIAMPVIKGLLVAGGGSLASERYVKLEQLELFNSLKNAEPAKPIDSDSGVEIIAISEVKDPTGYSKEVLSPAMADILINYLKELAPRMKTLHLKGKYLRDLNIEGLYFIHKYI